MILAILQARMSSTRLPGKVMKPLAGAPMLERHIERVRRSELIDVLVLATSDHENDDAIADLGAHLSTHVHRGSLDDVLDRFYRAALPYAPDHVVRLTGDCPLADPEVIDQVIRLYLDGRYDYASNALIPTFPDGLDVEVFRFSCLEEAWREAQLPSEREHVTPFIHKRPQRYRIGVLGADEDLSSLRWTVDTAEDYALVSKIYEALYPVNPAFTTEEVVRWLEEHPDLAEMNTDQQRNEGYLKSLAEDPDGC